MLLLVTTFGLLLLLVLLVCADARGGSLAEAIHGPSEHGLRYIVLLVLVMAFVSLMVAIPAA
jgi:hypothetical protein